MIYIQAPALTSGQPRDRIVFGHGRLRLAVSFLFARSLRFSPTDNEAETYRTKRDSTLKRDVLWLIQYTEDKEIPTDLVFSIRLKQRHRALNKILTQASRPFSPFPFHNQSPSTASSSLFSIGSFGELDEGAVLLAHQVDRSDLTKLVEMVSEKGIESV